HKGWRLDMDESLCSLLQSLAGRLGISPMTFDAIMVTPTEDDMARHKPLSHPPPGVPLDAMRARIALLKYMNRLVTPLLHYVDVSVYEDEAKYYRDSVVIKELKFLTKLSVATRHGTSTAAQKDA